MKEQPVAHFTICAGPNQQAVDHAHQGRIRNMTRADVHDERRAVGKGTALKIVVR